MRIYVVYVYESDGKICKCYINEKFYDWVVSKVELFLIINFCIEVNELFLWENVFLFVILGGDWLFLVYLFISVYRIRFKDE